MITTKLGLKARDSYVVVTLRGELDLVDAPSVAASLAAAADREPWIVVDLAGLEFIDCSGVAALVRGRRRARKAGGDLLIAAPRPQVLRFLSVSPVMPPFSVYATAEEAVRGIDRGNERLRA